MNKYCPKPFASIHMYTDQDLNPTVRPCCNYKPIKQYTTINDYLQSSELASLQQHLLTKESLPVGCEACKIEEDNNLPSLRKKYFNVLGHKTQTKIVDLEIFPGNACNLSCLSCNPSHSTKSGQEYAKLGWIKQSIVINHEDHALEVIKQLPDLKSIGFIGGEFFVTKHNIELLDTVIEKNLKAQIITNGTQLTKKHLERLQKISDLDVMVSVDGTGPTFEFLRYPAQWLVVQSNIVALQQALPGAKIHLSAVLQFLNLQNIIELFEYANVRRLPINVIPLSYPAWLRSEVLTAAEHQQLIEVIQKQLTVAKLTKTQKQLMADTCRMLETVQHSPTQREQFVSRTSQLVRLRNIAQPTINSVFGVLENLAQEVWQEVIQ
jgi:sulfatase maturation enzyme AslB (radical SAM superfamily)